MKGETSQQFVLRHQHTIALGIIVCAVIATAIVVRGNDKKNTLPEGIFPVGTAENRAALAEPDTDGDGLKDWEEVLWGTSPKMADTDGDGTNDKAEQEEAQQKQRDYLAEIQKGLAQDTAADWASLSYTQKVSRFLLDGYLSYKQSGATVDMNSAEQIVKGLPTYETRSYDHKTYSSKDIHISQESGATALRTYGNTLGTILTKPEGEKSVNEISTFVAFGQSEDRGVFKQQLQQVVDDYSFVINGALAMSVPSTLTSAHIALLNSLEAVKADFLFMIDNVDRDPVAGIVAFESYKKSSDARTQAFLGIRQILKNNNVVFEENEPGHILNLEK